MLFNLQAIHTALTDFQANFESINDTLEIRRETFTPAMIGQIVDAYDFLNGLLRQGMDLFTPAGLHSLLELNHIVLCGRKPEDRQHYYQHLVETRKSFQLRIAPIKTWVLANRSGENAWKLATGFYTRMLSRPQLFLEGNHRTGNIILNYLLVSKQAAPFIVQADTARDYLDLSGNIKFTSKDNTLESAFMMPGHAKRFREFLKQNGRESFLCPV